MGCPLQRECRFPSRRITDYRWTKGAVRALLLAGVLGGTLIAQTAATGASLADAARQAFTRRDYRRAATLYAELASSTPSSSPGSGSDALLMESKCLVNLDEFSRAEGTLRTFLERQPRSSEALYLLGYVLQREGQPANSLKVFTQAAAIRPPLPDDLKLVALDYVLLDDYNDAVHWLTRALSAAPDNAEAWYDLGRAQMHQGHFDEAVAAFRHTLALQPGNVKAMDNLGVSLEAQNKPEEALKQYAAGLKLTEQTGRGDEHLLLDFGMLLNNRGAFAEASPLLLQAVRLAPADPRALEELGRSYTGQGENDAARGALEHAATLDPKNARLHFQLGRTYRSLGLSALSQAEFQRSSALYANGTGSPDH